MSKYTTEVRFICETKSGLTESVGLSDVDTVIANSYDKIFNTSWDIYDEEYRSVLCSKILKHYYTREICAETVGLWEMWLNERMGLIMPYYNKLYESLLYINQFPNPFYDTDYYDEMESTEKQDETTNVDSTNKTTSTTAQNTEENSEDWNKYSDTPQGAITGLENDKYLTNANKATHEGNQDVNTTFTGTDTNDSDTVRNLNTTDNYLKHVYGKFNSSKSYWNILKEIRDNIINVDEMIIDELSDLFFTLW